MAHGGSGVALHLSKALFGQVADINLVQMP